MNLQIISFDAWERNGWYSNEGWLSHLASLAPEYSEVLEQRGRWQDTWEVCAGFYCDRAAVARLLSWLDDDGWWVSSSDGAPIANAKVMARRGCVWTAEKLRALTPKFRSYEMPDRISFDGWVMRDLEELLE